jgi:hypothetical protein
LSDLESKLTPPSKLKQTLQWTLAFGRLTEYSTTRTRREALAEILKVQQQCDRLTQEAIDATLLYYVGGKRLDLAVGEEVLQRREGLQGWPWDLSRFSLQKRRDELRAKGGGREIANPFDLNDQASGHREPARPPSKIREEQKALRGAKPLPKEKLRGPIL